jgi:hypothetical protein
VQASSVHGRPATEPVRDHSARRGRAGLRQLMRRTLERHGHRARTHDVSHAMTLAERQRSVPPVVERRDHAGLNGPTSRSASSAFIRRSRVRVGLHGHVTMTGALSQRGVSRETFAAVGAGAQGQRVSGSSNGRGDVVQKASILIVEESAPWTRSSPCSRPRATTRVTPPLVSANRAPDSRGNPGGFAPPRG